MKKMHLKVLGSRCVKNFKKFGANFRVMSEPVIHLSAISIHVRYVHTDLQILQWNWDFEKFLRCHALCHYIIKVTIIFYI